MNILVSGDGRACLADFGLALVAESQTMTTSTSATNRGTLRWLAPEVLDSSRERERDARKRDVYAFACSVLEVRALFVSPSQSHSDLFF